MLDAYTDAGQHLASSIKHLRLLLPLVRHAPDLIAAIICHQQRAITQHQHSHRTPPHVEASRIGYPAGQEVLVSTLWLTVVEWDANDFVTAAQLAIPRAVQGDKSITLILFREHIARVKNDAQRRRMRFDQYVRYDRFLHQLRLLALPARVFVFAHVSKGPAV